MKQPVFGQLLFPSLLIFLFPSSFFLIIRQQTSLSGINIDVAKTDNAALPKRGRI